MKFIAHGRYEQLLSIVDVIRANYFHVSVNCKIRSDAVLHVVLNERNLSDRPHLANLSTQRTSMHAISAPYLLA